MPHRNRVTPHGDIVVSPLRGAFMGNRGCLHRGTDIVRPWNGRRWITCVLAFRGWVAPKWEPGRWTALYFHDEAVAFAAGHRPCALCRRADYERYRAAFGGGGADEMDARLHADRLDGRRKRVHVRPWGELPAGTFVDIDGVAVRVEPTTVRPWFPDRGYGRARPRPADGDAVVLTPRANVDVLLAGYELDRVSG